MVQWQSRYKCYPVMVRVITGYVALPNTEQICKIINEANDQRKYALIQLG